MNENDKQANDVSRSRRAIPIPGGVDVPTSYSEMRESLGKDWLNPTREVEKSPTLFNEGVRDEYVKEVAAGVNGEVSRREDRTILAMVRDAMEELTEGMDDDDVVSHDQFDRVVLSVLAARRAEVSPFRSARSTSALSLMELFRLYLMVGSKRVITVKEMVRSGDFAGTWSATENPTPLTVHAFCTFSGLLVQTFNRWLDEESDRGDAARFVKQYIDAHVIERGLLGVYNSRLSQIITGLSEKSEVTTRSESRSINISIDGASLDLRKRKRVTDEASYVDLDDEDGDDEGDDDDRNG